MLSLSETETETWENGWMSEGEAVTELLLLLIVIVAAAVQFVMCRIVVAVDFYINFCHIATRGECKAHVNNNDAF